MVTNSNTGFKLLSSQLLGNIFIPKYYDPDITARLDLLGKTHNLVTLGKLVEEGDIDVKTGDEIGKMAYGTGFNPFVRTSDISNWEIKTDPKQGVSEKIYDLNKQDVAPEDIFVVRDGTYLVGVSCMVTEYDSKILYCGGIYRLRVINKQILDPYLLLALLNSPVVKKQIRSKQFTRDIIDTIGKRLFEITLPIPKDKTVCKTICDKTRKVVLERIALRDAAKKIFQRAEVC